ncbi:MAG: shikimate kinase [bacterium]
MAKNIILIGLMGCGKTTIGRLIAEKLNKKFVDTDELIEKEMQKNINEIFKLYGENFFRELESKIIKKITLEINQVISTGGGIVEIPENIECLKQNSMIFYLYAPVEELFRRIKNENNRPLLKNDNPLETLEKLLNKRERFYNRANIKINTVNKEFDKIISEIIREYENNEQ